MFHFFCCEKLSNLMDFFAKILFKLIRAMNTLIVNLVYYSFPLHQLKGNLIKYIEQSREFIYNFSL